MKKTIPVVLGGLVLLAGITAVALPTILHKAGLHPAYDGPRPVLLATAANSVAILAQRQ